MMESVLGKEAMHNLEQNLKLRKYEGCPMYQRYMANHLKILDKTKAGNATGAVIENQEEVAATEAIEASNASKAIEATNSIKTFQASNFIKTFEASNSIKAFEIRGQQLCQGYQS